MFCTVKCKTNFFRGGGDISDELGLANAHMHFGCAKKSNKWGGTQFKPFFDLLARGIVECYSRVLCMDANMALWVVVPELRARGS